MTRKVVNRNGRPLESDVPECANSVSIALHDWPQVRRSPCAFRNERREEGLEPSCKTNSSFPPRCCQTQRRFLPGAPCRFLFPSPSFKFSTFRQVEPSIRVNRCTSTHDTLPSLLRVLSESDRGCLVKNPTTKIGDRGRSNSFGKDLPYVVSLQSRPGAFFNIRPFRTRHHCTPS